MILQAVKKMHHSQISKRSQTHGWLILCVLLLGSTGLSLWATGCGSAEWQQKANQVGLEVKRKPTVVHFNFPKNGVFTTQTFYDFPYPHALRLDKDGTPSLKAFPAPKRKKKCNLPSTKNQTVNVLLSGINPDTYINDLVKVSNEQSKGFSLNPAIFFRFNRALHKRSIPPPDTTTSTGSPIFLVNVDKNSPEQGQRIPVFIHPGLKSRFLPDHVVVIRPIPGFVLHPKTLYAVVILTHVRDSEGWPLEAPQALTQLAAATAPKDPTLQKLYPSYHPVFALLQEKWKIAPEQVAAATVFQTGDPLTQLKKMREFVWNKIPKPTQPKALRCSSNASSTPYVTCIGTYAAPQFQKGETPYLDADSGFFTFDAQGNPNYTMDDLRVAITIPKRYLAKGAPQKRPIPIVMYGHGTGGNYRTIINNGTSRFLANSGIAGIGIDQAVNGARTKTLAGTRLDFLFFNALNLPAARDNVRQSALDYYWQARFLAELKIEYKGQTFVFDKKKIWFMGHSQGGLTGPLVLAFEKNVSAAYLSAPGGYLIHTLLYKTQPVEPILLSAVLDYLICDEKKSISVFHPVLSMVQNFFDPADPVNYTPSILNGSRPPIQLFMTEGLTDQYAPPQVFEPLAIAMGLPLLGPYYQPILGLDIRKLPRYKLPVRGNFVHPSGQRMTVGFTQHQLCKRPNGTPCDGHFVAFYNKNARRNWQTFFQSLLYSDIAEIQ